MCSVIFLYLMCFNSMHLLFFLVSKLSCYRPAKVFSTWLLCPLDKSNQEPTFKHIFQYLILRCKGNFHKWSLLNWVTALIDHLHPLWNTYCPMPKALQMHMPCRPLSWPVLSKGTFCDGGNALYFRCPMWKPFVLSEYRALEVCLVRLRSWTLPSI